MPEQAEPGARPEASAPPDLSEQLATLTEVIRQQGVLLQRMCEIVTQQTGVDPRASVQQIGEATLRERALGPGPSQDRKRPAPDDGGQSSSRRLPRPPRSRPQGRGSSGRQHARDTHQRGQPQRIQSCVICGGPHWPRQCEQREGRCFGCGQSGHIRTACPRAASLSPSSASAQPASQQSYGASPSDHQEDSTAADRVATGINVISGF